MEIFPLQINYSVIFHKSPTGHLNQIHKANERQPLLPVSQSLQIFHKFYRNLSSRGHLRR
jgi:hypothetical protein